MKCRCLLAHWYVGRQIDSTAEPPHIVRLEIANVHMNRGHVRVAGMDDKAYTRRKKRGAERYFERRRRRLRQRLAMDGGEVHAALFDQRGVFPHARDAAAGAAIVVPGILAI